MARAVPRADIVSFSNARINVLLALFALCFIALLTWSSM